MSINPYINFKGNCTEAVHFYAKIFDIKDPQILTYGDLPPNDEFPIEEDMKKFVMHASLNINGVNIMLSDCPPYMNLEVGNNISLVYTSDNVKQIEYLYNILSIEGQVNMELQETFWSKCYASVVDKFGVGWQLIFDDGKVHTQ